MKSYDNLLCFEKSFEIGKFKSFVRIGLISKPSNADFWLAGFTAAPLS